MRFDSLSHNVREVAGLILLGISLPSIPLGLIMSIETKSYLIGGTSGSGVDWFMAATGVAVCTAVIGAIMVPSDSW
jgi:hypothetical protein